MPVPDTRVEMQIDGVWTDITNDAYGSVGITHTRGRSGEGTRVDPASVTMQLKSPNGKYDRRNPRSENFGKIGTNTPIRESVDGADTALYLPDAAGIAQASTPDVAALDIVGDIDVRADLTPTTWAGAFPAGAWEVMGKYAITAAQRSWRLLVLTDGRLEFAWSPDGTTLVLVSSTAPVPHAPGRRGAIRATLDVNNGASGRTVVFYTAPTLAGPWVQLGASVTTAGTTSIYSSTAPLEIGDLSSLGFNDQQMLVHGAEVRSGIGGTIVAAPVFSVQTVGAASFTDSAGRVWAVSGGAEITDRRYRFVVEVPYWSPRFSVNGDDMYLPIQGAGILRRLDQGAKALESTLRRRIPTYGPLAYWPMEEGANATQAYSPIAGVGPMTVSGLSWGSDNSLAGSNALPTVSDTARFFAGVRPGPDGEWRVELVFNLDAMPTTLTDMVLVRTTGTTPRVLVQVQTNNVRLIGQDAAGDQVYLINLTAPGFTGQWNRLTISNSTSGGTITARVGWVTIGEGGYGAPTSYSGRAGHVTSVEAAYGSDVQSLALGHLSVFSTEAASNNAYSYADHGFSGETAGARMRRLTTEEGVPFTLIGATSDQTPMGPQRPDTLLNLLAECEAADGGILYEDRNRIGLMYRGRATLYNQEPALTLPYSKIQQPFEPVDDDSRIRNDVTRSRTGGSSARVVREDGPLSVQAPPLGVGTYDESVPVSVDTDEQLEQIAGWAMHQGTWDEARYKQLRILLHKHPDLVEAVLALDIGSIIRITDLPAYWPPGPIDLMVEGYREDQTSLTWEVTFACSPAGPWTVGVMEDTVLGRADTDGSELAAAVTATGTVLPITVTDGPAWITTVGNPTEFPFDVAFGGEVATVTRITGVAEDSFGRTVSSGWGTADSGQSWTTSGGTAADYSVASGTGRHIMSTRGTIYHTLVPVAVPDVDLRVDWSLSAVPAGDSAYVFPLVRYVDATHTYLARIQIAAGGAMTVTLRKRDGAETQLGSAYATGLTYTAGAWYTVRLAMTGSQLSTKVWLRGSPEPEAWQLTASDTALTAAGSVGVRSLLASATTNTLPVTCQFDGLYVDPQAMTVTRSVNGISKSHSAGAALSLAHPMRAAL